MSTLRFVSPPIESHFILFSHGNFALHTIVLIEVGHSLFRLESNANPGALILWNCSDIQLNSESHRSSIVNNILNAADLFKRSVDRSGNRQNTKEIEFSCGGTL